MTPEQKQQLKRLYHSEYGYMQVREKRNLYSIDEKTAQHLVQLGFAEYNHIAMTKFIQLTPAGCVEATRETEK